EHAWRHDAIIAQSPALPGLSRIRNLKLLYWQYEARARLQRDPFPAARARRAPSTGRGGVVLHLGGWKGKIAGGTHWRRWWRIPAMPGLALGLCTCLSIALAAQPPQEPGPSREPPTAKPAGQEEAAAAPAARIPEMQVSRTDAGAGENERNENVAV